jgi:anti-anti-sigma factor
MNTLLQQRLWRAEFCTTPVVKVAVEQLSAAVVLVTIRGVIAVEHVAQLQAQLHAAAGVEPRFVIVTATHLRGLCPEGVAALVELRQHLSNSGGEVWLTGLTAPVWLALRVAGVERLFTIRESVEGMQVDWPSL